MNLGLTGKVVVISGSSRGIGLAIARTMVEEGANVLLTGRADAALAAAAATFDTSSTSGRAASYVGDLTDPRNADACVQRAQQLWGRIDTIVANVGDGRSAAGWNIDDSEWDRQLNQNLSGAMRLVRSAIPHLKNSEGSNVIFIASIAGLEDIGAPIAYATAKAGLVAFAKSLSRSVAPIRVNTIAPGNVLFEGGSWDKKLKADETGIMTRITNDVPLMRFGRPQEIADAVAFLASARASFITGACLTVDGGQSRRFV